MIGLSCSKVHEICVSPSFKRFAKDDKGTRSKCENIDYIKVLHLRNIVTNRKNKKVTDLKAPEYMSESVCSLLKWPGGKQSELRLLLKKNPEVFPKTIGAYYEPFVGGGAVYFSVKSDRLLINDKCEELVSMYRFIREEDRDFYKALSDVDAHWNASSKLIDRYKERILALYHSDGDFAEFLTKNQDRLLTGLWSGKHDFIKLLGKTFSQKLKRIKLVEAKHGKLKDDDVIANVEGAIKAASYTFLRDCYNHSKKYKLTEQQKVVCFYFLRDYCFSSMFRFNSDGHFNVPYGGISYNRKSPAFREELWKSPRIVSHLQKSTIENMDFLDFFEKHPPKADDFIFVDPPYDSEFSTYDKSEFGKTDHVRLATFLKETKAKFMLIIKNTDFISKLYESPGISRIPFSKKYSVSFMDRNDKKVEHLIIKNY